MPPTEPVLLAEFLIAPGTSIVPDFPVHPGVEVTSRQEGDYVRVTYTEVAHWDPCPLCHGVGWQPNPLGPEE